MSYCYDDLPRADILRLIPAEGRVIGSIGCGYASTEAVLVKEGREIHGVDVAPEVQAIASSRLKSFHLIRAGEAIPWEPASLDGLILADVLEHIPAAWDALRQFATFVRPGGWVAISVPNMRSWEMFRHFMLRADWPEKDTGMFDRTHIQMMSQRRLYRWCDSAGLSVEKVFDRYDPNGPRRRRFFKTLDWATLRLFHDFLTYQVQCLCRRRESP